MKKSIFKILIYCSLLLTSITSFNLVFAQGSEQGYLESPIRATNIYALVYDIVDIMIRFGYIAVVLAIVYSGYLFVTARGNAEKIKKAKNTFFYIIIGSLILLGAQALSGTLCDTAKSFDSNIECRTDFIDDIKNGASNLFSKNTENSLNDESVASGEDANSKLSDQEKIEKFLKEANADSNIASNRSCVAYFKKPVIILSQSNPNEFDDAFTGDTSVPVPTDTGTPNSSNSGDNDTASFVVPDNSNTPSPSEVINRHVESPLVQNYTPPPSPQDDVVVSNPSGVTKDGGLDDIIKPSPNTPPTNPAPQGNITVYDPSPKPDPQGTVTVSNPSGTTQNDDDEFAKYIRQNQPYKPHIPDEHWDNVDLGLGIDPNKSDISKNPQLTPEQYQKLAGQVSNYGNVTLQGLDSNGMPVNLNLTGLVNDPDYAKNPTPVQIDGFLTGITLTNLKGVETDEEAIKFLRETVGANGDIVKISADGYVDENGNYIPLQDEMFCFCPDENTGTYPDFVTITEGKIENDGFFAQSTLEPQTITMSNVEFYDPSNYQNVSSFNLWNDFYKKDYSSGVNKSAKIIKQELNDIKNTDYVEIGQSNNPNNDSTKKILISETAGNVPDPDFWHTHEPYDQVIKESEIEEKLPYYIEGVESAECKMGKCKPVENIIVVGGNLKDNSAYILGTDNIVVGSDFIGYRQPDQLKVTGSHEAYHKIEDEYGISKTIGAEIGRPQTDVNWINEYSMYPNGFGGHARDNNKEYTTSILNTLDSPVWQERVQEQYAKDPESVKEYRKTLGIIKDHLVKNKGFDESVPIVEDLGNKIKIIDDKIIGNNQQP